MGHTIAVMNTKGGVGKSTVVMAIAETLSVYHGKNVLVVDSDSQTSMSTMLMSMSRWEEMERRHLTLVDYLMATVLDGATPDWRDFIAIGVSDVDDARSVHLMPSHMELSLFERFVSAEKREGDLRAAARNFLASAKRAFDIVLIDCPPGLSVLTECWLREADFFLPPTKPDYLAFRGLAVLKRFREDHGGQGFANLIGVLVNLKDQRISSDDEWHKRLAADPANRCFVTAIPRRAYIQRAADYDPERRTYLAKYPGDAGQSVRAVTDELLTRLADSVWQGKARPAAHVGDQAAETFAAGDQSVAARLAAAIIAPAVVTAAPVAADFEAVVEEEAPMPLGPATEEAGATVFPSAVTVSPVAPAIRRVGFMAELPARAASPAAASATLGLRSPPRQQVPARDPVAAADPPAAPAKPGPA